MEKNEYQVMYDLEQTHWWFLGKQFLLSSLLKRLQERKFRQAKILDIGCGTGKNIQISQGFGTTFGVELSADALRFLRKRGLKNILQSDITSDLPFKDDSFSIILCLDVLEHIEDDHHLLQEMNRICKPGGVMILTVPAFQFLWGQHDVALHHKRRYSRHLLRRKIGSFHCQVIEESYFNFFLFLPILMVRKLLSRKENRSDFSIDMPSVLNRILSRIYLLELCLLHRIRLPFGVSYLAVIEKNG